MKQNGLTERQHRFVEHYLTSGNATDAAIKAGYSAKTAQWIGPRLVTKTHVASAVAAGREKFDEFAGLTRQRVVEGLLAEAEFRGDGSSASARVAAWGHLARIRGMFVDKAELTSPDGSMRPTIVQVVGVGSRGPSDT